VLTKTNNFKESSGSVSETKNYQVETFEVDSGDGKIITYRVIDTIGIGDTGLSPEAVLFRIAMIAREVREHGINRVFFVTDGRFKEQEAKAFQVLKEVIFDEGVFNNTAIVRTNFAEFRSTSKCDEDVQNLLGLNQTSFPIISKIVQTDRSNIIHVNNPPLVGSEEEITVAQENRKSSRNVLLAYLAVHETVYKPKNIDEINSRIDGYVNAEKNQKERIRRYH